MRLPKGSFQRSELMAPLPLAASCPPRGAEGEQSLDPEPACHGQTRRLFRSVRPVPDQRLAIPARTPFLDRECPFVRLLILVNAQRVASVRKATCMHAVLLTLADAFAVSLVTDVAIVALSTGDGNVYPVPMHVIHCRAVSPRGH